MSIIGLSDRLRLPRRGKIRLGEKKMSGKSGREYPVALDYFVVPDEVKEFYGEKPRILDIMLPMEDRESFFPQNYKRYGSSAGLICKGNGEMAEEVGDGGMAEIECLGKDCEWYKSGDCKQIGNFQAILPKVKGLGVYQIDTSSYNSIINLNSGIEMIRGMLGRISWVPLVLEVQMQEAHPLVDGKRIKTIIPVMSITAEMTIYDLLKWKSRMPAPQVAIENPDVDEKPELLFPKTDNQPIGVADRENKPEQETKEKETQKKKQEDKPSAREKKQTKEKPQPAGQKKETKTEPKDGDKEKDSIDIGRNELNIRLHSLKKKLTEINYFSDDGSYREWLAMKFDGKRSSKDLDKMQLVLAIGMMAKAYNEHAEKEKK